MYLNSDDYPQNYPPALNGMCGMGEDPAPSESWWQTAIKSITPLALFAPSTVSITPSRSQMIGKKVIQSPQYSSPIGPPTAADDPLNARVDNLDRAGALSPTEKFLAKDYIRQGRTAEAVSILTEKEGKMSGAKSGILDKVDQFLPAGYKIREEAISGLPNYAIYGVAAAMGLFFLRPRKK